MDDVIYLCMTATEQDEDGVIHEVIHKRRVYCKVESITRSEYFNAGRAGLNPEYQFTMFFGDYEGEAIAEYNGKTYTIYRVYRSGADYIELYVERRGGTNGLAEKP